MITFLKYVTVLIIGVVSGFLLGFNHGIRRKEKFLAEMFDKHNKGI